MNPSILMNGEMTGLFKFCRMLGPLGIVVGIALAGFDIVPCVVVLLIAIPFTLGIEIAAFVQRRKRWWLEVEPAGFVVTDSRGRREYQDEDIQSIAYHLKNTYMNGELKGYKRYGTLWIAQESQPLRMENHYKTGVVDPAGVFIERIISLLHDGFDAALEHGLSIAGENWKLTSRELTYQERKREEVLPIAEIAAIDSYEEKMSIWRRGEAEACVHFPVQGRNIWLLRMLLLPRLVKNPAEDQPPSEGLGRILFQRKASAFLGIFFYCVGALFLLLGAIGCLAALKEPPALLIGLMFGAMGIVLILGGRSYKRSNFRCHEWGVYQAGLFGERQLKYLDVSSFTHSATRQYHNGAYIGTAVVLRFEPLPNRGKTVTYSTTLQANDAAMQSLEELRDFVAKMIAGRMMNELANGNPVSWTSNITFLPTAFEFRPSGFLGRKAAQQLAYANYGGWNMAEGFFYLFEKGQTKAVFNENVSSPNFFPGFFLLLKLFHEDQPAAETT